MADCFGCVVKVLGWSRGEWAAKNEAFTSLYVRLVERLNAVQIAITFTLKVG